MKIKIERRDAPTAELFVKIMGEQEEDAAKNRPTAFILPGGPGADHSVYLTYACLKTVADLVFHDPRGCGQSDKNELSDCSMNNYIEDVEAIREHLGLKKITVIGKSYGSMCALGYALRYPDRVEKLVLAAGAPSYHFLETAKENLKRFGSKEQVKIAEKLWTGSFASREELLEYFRLTQPLYSVKARSHSNKTDLNKKSNQFSYEVLNEGFRQRFWHFDYENVLIQLQCPTLVLAGKEDWVNDVSHAIFMAERIPHSRLHIFEQASHAMEADKGEEFFQVIADFIG